MKIGDRLHLQGSFDKDSFAFLRQMGADGLTVNISSGLKGNPTGPSVLPEDTVQRLVSGDHWHKDDLLALREVCEAHGLELNALAHTPEHRWHEIFTGGARRDELCDHWCRSLEAMREAGIPVLQYWWVSNQGAAHRNWHTDVAIPIRGGARAEGFDMAKARAIETRREPLYAEEQLWETLEYFLRRVIPVAQSCGVRMAMHPSDPQVPMLNGMPRILRSPEAFDRMLEIVPSSSNAINFCQGCFSQMLSAEGVYAAIAHFLRRDAIAYVHFRNVSPDSRPDRFTEAFWDEGKVDMPRAMRAYQQGGYTGYLAPDHHPHVVGDTLWGHRSRGFALGYMRGLKQSLPAPAAPAH